MESILVLIGGGVIGVVAFYAGQEHEKNRIEESLQRWRQAALRGTLDNQRKLEEGK